MKTDFESIKDPHQYYTVHNTCKLQTVATQLAYEIEAPSSGILFIGRSS